MLEGCQCWYEYLAVFISILRVLFLSVDSLKLGSLSSFSGNGVKIALGFLSAERCISLKHKGLKLF